MTSFMPSLVSFHRQGRRGLGIGGERGIGGGLGENIGDEFGAKEKPHEGNILDYKLL